MTVGGAPGTPRPLFEDEVGGRLRRANGLEIPLH
jgi:hypothetical protein